MYAQLCKRLSEEAPNFEPPGYPCTFRLLLLNTCKAEFEKRSETFDKYASNPELDEDERRQLAKRKMLGNIKFIGELGKLEIMSEAIIHRCIQQLLASRKGCDASEDLECLCQIMRTCGRILDSDKGKMLMNQYFGRMANLAENPELQPRIRFMLKDVIELRRDNWVPRKANVVEGPVPINQIRPDEHERIALNYRRDNNRNNHHDRDSDRFASVSELFRHPIKTRSSGIDDMLMGLNISSSTSNLITHPFNSPNGYGAQRGDVVSGGGTGGGFRTSNNQRNSGFNNYSNQRGQYKHNQNNSNNQYNNQSNKDIAPRFKKNLIVAREQDLDEIQLRPSANSMLFSKATVKSNPITNSRPIDPPLPIPNSVPKQPPTLLKETVPIKQVSVEKPKQSKKDKGPNKEEILKKFTSILTDYLKSEVDLKQAIDSYKELNVPEKFSKDIISRTLTHTLEKTDDEEREKSVKLLSCLRKESLLNANLIQESFRTLLNLMDEEGENETTTKMSCAGAALVAHAVREQLMSLVDVAALTDNGSHYPLFLYVLQRLHKLIGKNELLELFNSSKINLLSQLPESDKTKERLAEILEERDLTFLYPLLRIQAELAKQLHADPNPQQFYKWIKENLDPTNYTDPGFINALVTVLLKYIIQEAAACTPGDEKAIIEKERSFLERYRPILTAFLHEQSALQLVAVYSLQVHFFSLGFPRGQLLRWFMAFYDLEIIEEEAFLNWKEDVTDAYPGKGQALFQVNIFITVSVKVYLRLVMILIFIATLVPLFAPYEIYR
ncbi:eukaryotic translation initiation factor 4 gamma 2 [Agrilus planipennis]|uniref:Eukaryotic translation initiation factor 4 gamma 2 n=1 Tax=Agrilus planipennis TaxID=224129 RepID=A0A1W4XV33_AGRPL|nr:eukaryotic translation initiation factor 4 gamma 2 [Agrilus planipennis]XP_018336292.1 eukaryotic translation initiation factor 4 gamma 2 [Agrilus planipennis]XP_018336293.1 eukaryotic translation initiation factor 4 gamma 2 [Agrilus planipennis]